MLTYSDSVRFCLTVMLLWPVASIVQAADIDLPWFTIDGGGTMVGRSGEIRLDGTIGQPDAGVMSSGRFELTGGFWAVTQHPACSPTGPFVVHRASDPAAATSASSPCSGYIDPRVESSDGITADLGIDHIMFAFNEPVVGAGGGPVGVDDFVVTQTGAGPAPVIKAVERVGSVTYRVILDRPVATQEWTTVRAVVENACGVEIHNVGDLGPGSVEPDRIDIGRLPGDVNSDGQVSPLDLLKLRQFLSGGGGAPCANEGNYFDIDRDGVFPEPQDLIRFRQLLAGTGTATRPWAGVTMHSDQP